VRNRERAPRKFPHQIEHLRLPAPLLGSGDHSNRSKIDVTNEPSHRTPHSGGECNFVIAEDVLDEDIVDRVQKIFAVDRIRPGVNIRVELRARAKQVFYLRLEFDVGHLLSPEIEGFVGAKAYAAICC
jgi:hypothetical protein